MSWVDLEGESSVPRGSGSFVRAGDVEIVYPCFRTKMLAGPTEAETERFVLIRIGREEAVLSVAQASALVGALVGVMNEHQSAMAREASGVGSSEHDRQVIRSAREALLGRLK